MRIKNKNMKWRNSYFAIFTLLAFVAISFQSCLDNDDDLVVGDWALVWEDNFDGDQGTLPNPDFWNFDIGTDWGNQQLEYDTDRAENASLDGEGNLAIVARRENFAGSAFTSARITTKGKVEQAYGRFEARMKLPYGPGIWPAFWLLGSNIDEVGWPQCGEIDMMELRGQLPNINNSSLHGPGYSGGNSITKSFTLEQDRFDNDFHVFAVEWGVDYMYFFVDDTLFMKVTPEDIPGEWVYDHPFHVILNLAVGGNYVGFPTSQTPFPQTMLIDYVKIYENRN